MAGILDAAERHFLERGYDEVRVDAIAADADVAVGSIYNYFGNKEGLYRAFSERAMELHELYMTEGWDDKRPPLHQLLDQAGRLTRFGREHQGYLRALATPPRSEEVRRHLAEHERRTAALIEAAVRKGDARPLDARPAASWLWSSWMGTLTMGGEVDKLIESGLRIVVGGLASDRARESDELVRRILEPTRRVAGPVHASRGVAVRREPVAPALRSELPGLAIWTTSADGRSGRTPAAVRRRLNAARGRPAAAEAAGVPGESSPWAYRVALRRLGIDPDAPRSPVDEVVLRRAGAELPPDLGMPYDALLVAALETGVPVLAFDESALDGPLSLKPGESGGVVVADLARPLAELFGETVEDARPEGAERLTLAAVQVHGVPDLAVQDALWIAVELLEGRP